MEHFVSLLLRSIFTDNMVFAFFLGMCSYLAVSKNVKTSLGLGVAVIFVLCVTVPVDYLLQTKVLGANGLFGEDLTYLSFILFIAVIAGIVQLVEMIVERISRYVAGLSQVFDGDFVYGMHFEHLIERLNDCPFSKISHDIFLFQILRIKSFKFRKYEDTVFPDKNIIEPDLSAAVLRSLYHH